MNLPELGVGLNWFPGLEPVLKANEELIDVLEVEPQSFWRRERGASSMVLDLTALEGLRRRREPKLVHSVACPIGGTLAAPGAELEQVAAIARELAPPW